MNYEDMSKDLHDAYKKACNNYVKAFAEKQGLNFKSWAGDNVGAYAEFEEGYTFSFDEIVFDLQTKQPIGKALAYHVFCQNMPNKVNYPAYCGKAGFWRDAPEKDV